MRIRMSLSKKQILAVILMVVGVVVFFSDVPTERGGKFPVASLVGALMYITSRFWLNRLNEHRMDLPENRPRFKRVVEKAFGWVGGIANFVGFFCLALTPAVHFGVITFFVGAVIQQESWFLHSERVHREKVEYLTGIEARQKKTKRKKGKKC